MISNSEFGNIAFDLPKNQSNVIKVIGVGGGGSNAINHMFKQGIKGVDFVVCNTDSQALQNSPVPTKIQLGVNLTEGLGAGANPEVGQQSAIESLAEIEKVLDANTKMVFITAGMGGGTGTGAAPVIAKLAKEKDILTVGIVTIPFQFEGKVRGEQAMQGVNRLRKEVDSLIVINNNKLRDVYGNLGFKAGFSKADEVLATASRGIAEVITHHYTQNIDLKDAKTVLSKSGTAIMGSAYAVGDDRAKDAIAAALDSPLLNDNKISGAKNVLLLIVSGTNPEHEIKIDEIGEINDFIQNEAGHNANIIMGVGEDEQLGEGIAVTIIATGFNIEQQHEIVNTEPKKIIHTLGGEQKLVQHLVGSSNDGGFGMLTSNQESANNDRVVFNLVEETPVVPVVVNAAQEIDLIPMSEFIKNIDVTFEIVSPIQEHEFFITSAETRDLKVTNPQIVTFQEEKAVVLDLPISNIESNLIPASNEIKSIEVNEPVQFVPITEMTQNGIVVHSLEEYLDLESKLLDSKPEAPVSQVVVEDELNLTVRQVDTSITPSSEFNESVSPLEMTIEETLKLRAEERRRKLKEFNYKFHNSSSRIEEFEKEPAYKRSGVDLSSQKITNSNSRISLGTDSNDDTQLRSNNSFLHDNVD